MDIDWVVLVAADKELREMLKVAMLYREGSGIIMPDHACVCEMRKLADRLYEKYGVSLDAYC